MFYSTAPLFVQQHFCSSQSCRRRWAAVHKMSVAKQCIHFALIKCVFHPVEDSCWHPADYMFIRKQYLIGIGASPFPVEITPDSSFVIQPLIVSPYFEGDNENTDGMVPGLSLCADVRWRTSLLHTSSRPGLESSVWRSIPALPQGQLIPLHHSNA